MKYKDVVLQCFLAASLPIASQGFQIRTMPTTKIGERNVLTFSPMRRQSLPLQVSPSRDQDDQQNNFDMQHLLNSFLRTTLAAFLAGTLLLSSSAADASDGAPTGRRYWSIMEETTATSIERIAANEALAEYVMGTINTMYYDKSGGADFAPREFYNRWREYRAVATHKEELSVALKTSKLLQDLPEQADLESREGTVQGLKWLVSSLGDPYSAYLTREELRNELTQDSNGFLGLGAIVEAPKYKPDAAVAETSEAKGEAALQGISQPSDKTTKINGNGNGSNNNNKSMLTSSRIANLPVITAVAPDSPAERSGLVVGDRIVAVGEHNFIGFTRQELADILADKYSAESYFGYAEITIAKPVYAVSSIDDEYDDIPAAPGSLPKPRSAPEVVVGYRQTRVRLPTKAESSYAPPSEKATLNGGDSNVHYELLTSTSGSIFGRSKIYSDQVDNKVGYIRLTRFSKASTTSFINAIDALQDAGAQSYIFDLRNNYGGVIQEAMLTSSTLLRDSHSILCYTLNSRGGFTPHDVEEFAVDKRYPGYLLSKEPKTVTLNQIRRESPGMFAESGIAWTPPSSFASLHEQTVKRGILSRVSELYAPSSMSDQSFADGGDGALNIRRLRNQLGRLDPNVLAQLRAQKNIVILINEGTASAAEVFASSLHDNGRVVALVGSKSYGKGLIQHTFPLPDGGGLRLTVAEYLTPSLNHVTKVGSAQFDRDTGDFVGGGIRPDIICDSKQGIPSNIGADLCVGLALDALDEAADDLEDAVPKRGARRPSGQLVASALPANIAQRFSPKQ